MGFETNGNKEPCFSVIAETVAVKAKDLYRDASIPSVSYKRFCDKIHAYHRKYLSIMKNIKLVEKLKITRKSIENFKMEAKKLFDISACKCAIVSKCICPKESKVPPNEQEFLTNQITERKMLIGCFDVLETKRLRKHQMLKEQNTIRSAKHASADYASNYYSVENEGETENNWRFRRRKNRREPKVNLTLHLQATLFRNPLQVRNCV
ncbi:hypothetical protein AVEN_131634-1 [Araneus ventricosus]|uniref:Uncharacterized protein n=1 Tax=Araneus ventricosus TaxID=182803 RepID=A0A4Y2N3Z1_ARAVE|nr:hypothetical protein AVEN_131634-1 [Araneus ventricosus]